jgi:hypothetical protein
MNSELKITRRFHLKISRIFLIVIHDGIELKMEDGLGFSFNGPCQILIKILRITDWIVTL